MYEVSIGSKWEYHYIDSTHANLNDAIKAALWLVYCYNKEQRELYTYENYDEFAVDDTIHLIDYPKMKQVNNPAFVLSWFCQEDYIQIYKLDMNAQISRLRKHILKNRIDEDMLEEIINNFITAAFIQGLANKELDADSIISEVLNDYL